MLVTLIAVWLASKSSGTMGGFTKDGLVTYYLLGSVLNSIVFWWSSTNITFEIKNGEIGPKSLTKPISYYWQKFFEEFSWHTVSPIIGIITTIIVAFFVQAHIQINLSLETTLFMIASVFLGSVLFFNMSSCIGLLSFWFTETTSIAGTVWVGAFLLGGQSIPVSFFTGWVRNLINFLPFRYVYSFPIEVYLKSLNQSEILFGLGIQVLWICSLGLIYKILWAKGLEKYSAFGS